MPFPWTGHPLRVSRSFLRLHSRGPQDLASAPERPRLLPRVICGADTAVSVSVCVCVCLVYPFTAGAIGR